MMLCKYVEGQPQSDHPAAVFTFMEAVNAELTGNLFELVFAPAPFFEVHRNGYVRAYGVIVLKQRQQ